LIVDPAASVDDLRFELAGVDDFVKFGNAGTNWVACLGDTAMGSSFFSSDVIFALACMNASDQLETVLQ
jgi:hypothetical protein